MREANDIDVDSNRREPNVMVSKIDFATSLTFKAKAERGRQ